MTQHFGTLFIGKKQKYFFKLHFSVPDGELKFLQWIQEKCLVEILTQLCWAMSRVSVLWRYYWIKNQQKVILSGATSRWRHNRKKTGLKHFPQI